MDTSVFGKYDVLFISISEDGNNINVYKEYKEGTNSIAYIKVDTLMKILEEESEKKQCINTDL